MCSSTTSYRANHPHPLVSHQLFIHKCPCCSSSGPPVSQSKPVQTSACPKPSQSGLSDLYISNTKTRNSRRDFLVSANACMPLKHGRDDNGDTLRSLSWQQRHVTAVIMWPLPSSSNMSKPAGGFDALGFCLVIVGDRHPKENSDIFVDGNEIPQVNQIK